MSDIQEEWRDVNGFEGLYQISNKGRVSSLCYSAAHLGMEKRDSPLVKKNVTDRLGYEYTKLWRRGKNTTRRIHVLVAEHFVSSKPHKNSLVRHIDGDSRNNNAENLAWGDLKENSADARRHGTLKGSAVIGFFDDGSSRAYDFAADAKADGFEPSLIFAVIAGRQKKHGDAVWMRLGKEALDSAIRQAKREALLEAAEEFNCEPTGQNPAYPQFYSTHIWGVLHRMADDIGETK